MGDVHNGWRLHIKTNKKIGLEILESVGQEPSVRANMQMGMRRQTSQASILAPEDSTYTKPYTPNSTQPAST
jgi:hypothetical protein